MVEKLAVKTAKKIKQANPEETEPLDVLIFGFTIFYNLLLTWLLILTLGLAAGAFWLAAQIALSFMVLRILTGGAHLDQSFACTSATALLVFSFVFFPESPVFIYTALAVGLVCIVFYAPYYEPHQLVHSQKWERKKKYAAVLWVMISLLIYMLTGMPGFIKGVLLQALMLTPPGIYFTHALNSFTRKGGENHEKNSKNSV